MAAEVVALARNASGRELAAVVEVMRPRRVPPPAAAAPEGVAIA